MAFARSRPWRGLSFTRSTIWLWWFNNARWGFVTCGAHNYVSKYRVEKR